MTERLLKIKGAQLYYKDYDDTARLLDGVSTGGSGTAGKLKVKGTYLHYIDYNEDEYRLLGILTGNAGIKGRINIKGDYLLYVDYNEDERKLFPPITIERNYINYRFYNYSEPNGGSWASVWGNAVSDFTMAAPWAMYSYRDSEPPPGDEYWSILRGGLQFDTSDVPEDATIISAYIRIRKAFAVGGAPYNTGHFYIVNAPSLNEAYVPADYAYLRTCTILACDDGEYVEFGMESVYVNMTLNVAGIANILKGVGAVSKFGTRVDRDLDNDPPGSFGSCNPSLSDALISITYLP